VNRRPLLQTSLLVALSALAFALLICPRQAQGASFYSLIRKGNRFFKNDLYREALGYYLKGGEKNRKAIEPPFNAGAALYKSEDYVRSIEVLTRTLQSARKPDVQSNILYNMGNSSFQLGDYGKAAEYYKKGLELTPYDLNLKYNLELALKKLETQKKEQTESGRGGGMGKEAGFPEGGGSAGGGGEGEKNSASQGINRSAGVESARKDRQKSEDELQGAEGPDQAQGALSRDEAERLLRSVNADQSKIVGDYIRQKLGMSENEKDW
jgi:Ca-activated chloride channel family protein